VGEATAGDRGTEDASTGPGRGLDPRTRAGGATGGVDRSEGRTDAGLLDTVTTIVVESAGVATTNAGPLGRPASTNPHLGSGNRPVSSPWSGRGAS